MTYFFGFEPSTELSEDIVHAEHVIDSGSDEIYYPIRNKIAQQIGREIIDNLLVNLISVIPDEERQEKMRGIVKRIEGATETMLKILLGKDKNEDVLPNFDYMKNETIFDDNEGNMRVGFKLNDDTAKTILDGFEATTPDSVDKEKLKAALFAMNHGVVDHFVSRFSETLPLGFVKRKAVPVAKAGINKALEVAINKLFPQLPDESLNRLVKFYAHFIVKK